MSLYIALGAIFLTVFLLIMLVMRLLRTKYDRTSRRVRSMASRIPHEKSGSSIYDALKQTDLPVGVEKLLLGLGRIGGSDEKATSLSRQMLSEAGISHESGPGLLMGLRICSLFFFFSCYYLFLFRAIKQPLIAAGFALFILLFSFRLPDMMLRFRISQRRMHIGESLSDALDLLVICMEAGLGLNAALLRVAQEIGMRSPILSEQLLQVTQEMRTGLSRENALRNLCARNKVESLRILVGALVMADKLGTSLAETLRSQADSLRTRMRQSAEEQAAKAGIKILFPLILFIFPALFIVILGPGAISIMRNLSAMSGQ